jgi:hypothetical protein
LHLCLKIQNTPPASKNVKLILHTPLPWVHAKIYTEQHLRYATLCQSHSFSNGQLCAAYTWTTYLYETYTNCLLKFSGHTKLCSLKVLRYCKLFNVCLLLKIFQLSQLVMIAWLQAFHLYFLRQLLHISYNDLYKGPQIILVLFHEFKIFPHDSCYHAAFMAESDKVCWARQRSNDHILSSLYEHCMKKRKHCKHVWLAMSLKLCPIASVIW